MYCQFFPCKKNNSNNNNNNNNNNFLQEYVGTSY